MSEKCIRFQTLVDHARQERIPQADIAGQVAEHLTHSVPATTTTVDRALWGMAGMSVAVAVAVVFVSVQQGVVLSDPLVDWLRPLVMVMQ